MQPWRRAISMLSACSSPVVVRVVGVPTKPVLLRDEGHWFIKPLNKIRMIEYMLDWFRQYDPGMR